MIKWLVVLISLPIAFLTWCIAAFWVSGVIWYIDPGSTDHFYTDVISVLLGILWIYFYKKILFYNGKKIWGIGGKRHIVLLAICVIFYGYLLADRFLPIGKFRFQDFKTNEEFSAFIDKNFPKGSEAQKLIATLKQGGARCEVVPRQSYEKDLATLPREIDQSWFCEYGTGLFSYTPFTQYDVSVYCDKSFKLLDFYVSIYFCGP